MKLSCEKLGEIEGEPLVMGHFLPWYVGASPEAFRSKHDEAAPSLEPFRHWRDRRSEYGRTHLRQPLWGEYDSRDPEIIRKQIETAKAYGLDGFIVNLYGRNSAESLIARALLEGIESYNESNEGDPFLYCVSFDAQAQWPTEGKRPVSIVEDFRHLRDEWMGGFHLRCDGKRPLLIFPYDKPCKEYRKAADEVFDEGAVDIVWQGSGGEGQDASYAWVAPDENGPDGHWREPDSCGERSLEALYAAAAADPNVKYLVGGVWPGFNDQLVRWAWNGTPGDHRLRPRVICQDSTKGNALDLTWDVTADYIMRSRTGADNASKPMPIVQIVTWNDWAEDTSVEPDMRSGFKDLETCRRRIRALKTWRKQC